MAQCPSFVCADAFEHETCVEYCPILKRPKHHLHSKPCVSLDCPFWDEHQ